MGWNGSGQKGAAPAEPKVTAKKPSPVRGIVAGLLVVAASAVACFIFFSGSEKPQTEKAEKERGRIKEVAPAAAPVYKEEPKPEPPKKEKGIGEKLKKMTPEQRADYQWKKLEEMPLDLTVSSNRVVATGTEQIMAWIFTTEPGDLPPPLPMIPNHELAHFAEILIADNPVKEGDSEKVQEVKATVEMAKKELKEYLKKGGEPEEFFKYYRDQLTQMHQEREMSRQEAMRLMKEDPDIAAEFIDKVNEKLEAKGIKPIQFHPKMRAHFGID